ncbi:MAG: hypothetical protein IE889_09025 [Campylobacterales bacterium]|nr:hypothetical protein [Campylobacterales bacterium]
MQKPTPQQVEAMMTKKMGALPSFELLECINLSSMGYHSHRSLKIGKI